MRLYIGDPRGDGLLGVTIVGDEVLGSDVEAPEVLAGQVGPVDLVCRAAGNPLAAGGLVGDLVQLRLGVEFLSGCGQFPAGLESGREGAPAIRLTSSSAAGKALYSAAISGMTIVHLWVVPFNRSDENTIHFVMGR